MVTTLRITEEQASTAHLYVAKLLTQPSYGRSLYTPSSSSRDEGDFYLTVSCACVCVCVCVDQQKAVTGSDDEELYQC
jgi:hypothetical protein